MKKCRGPPGEKGESPPYYDQRQPPEELVGPTGSKGEKGDSGNTNDENYQRNKLNF